MDSDVEKLCKACHGCQVVGEFRAPEPMSRVLPPTAPWQDISADLLGPLPTGESILVVVDYFSRFLEVSVLKSTTSAKIIEAIHPIFARFGVPYSLRIDNGPHFVLEEFETFLQTQGVEHRKTTPLWSQANGEVERQNRFLLKCLQIAKVENKDWRSELVTWLTAYRSTPQATTGATPFSLMFGREMRSKLPELKRETVNPFKEEIRERDWSNKLKGKLYVDEKGGAVFRSINVGDEVLLRAEKSNKLSTNFRLSPFKVVRKAGSEVTVKNDTGVEFKRNAAFLKKYHAQEGNTSGVENGRSEGACAGAGEAQDKLSSDAQENKEDERVKVDDKGSEIHHQQENVRWSTRQVRRPARFKDFVIE